MTMLADKSGGAGTISFLYRRYGTDAQVAYGVEYSTNAGTSWVAVGSDFTAPATNDIQTFSQSVNVPGNIRFRIVCRTADNSNRRLNIDDILITDSPGSDTTPPAITTLTPADGAVGVPVATTALSIQFNEPVVKGTGNITLQSGETAVAVIDVASEAVQVSGSTATITLPAALSPSTDYHVLVAAGAFEDAAENAFAGISGATDWNFTTEAPDTTPPAITTLTPADGAVGVLVATTALSIQFDEPVVKGTGNITLQSGETAVAVIDVASEAVQVSGSTATITLPSALSPSTDYHVLVAAGAFKDAAENAFAGISGATDWNFTTEAPDTTGPVPTAFLPANGATNVALTTAVFRATFNEPITLVEPATLELRKVQGDVLVAAFDADNAIIEVINSNQLEIAPFNAPPLDYETAYYLSISAGALEDNLGNPSLAIGAPADTASWVFTTLPEPLPPSVVINKYANLGGGALDEIELLVTGNETPGSTVDMRGMIVKDFSSNMGATPSPTNGDGGGKYQFANVSLWQAVPVGTLVVLTGGNTSPDVNGADFSIEAGLADTGLFTQVGTGTFDISTTEMVMIKAAGSDAAGTTGGIHALAAGTAGPLFTSFTGPKLIASGTTGTSTGVIANNSNSVLADFSGTDATAVAAITMQFGGSNTPQNAVYITQLRGTTLGNGDGVVTLANATPESPFAGSPVFGSGLSAQSATLTLTATIPTVTLAQVTITVPTDFGAPGGVSLSGAGAGAATSSISGQTVTISGAAATTSNPLVVTISGLQTPVPSTGDFGNRSFAVSTAVSGSTPAAIATNPEGLLVIPMATLRQNNANAVPLALGELVAVEGVCTEENFSTGNTQACLQDATGGVALFNASLPSPFVRGNTYLVYGTVTQFNGVTQVSYTGFIDRGAGTEPTPVVLTIPALLANPEAYEGSVITIQNLNYSSGTWAASNNVVLQDGASNTITIRIQADTTATTPPTYPVNVTGVLGQFDTSSPFNSGYQLQPRDPDDLESIILPTVAINQADAQADPTSASPINFTVVFSTAVTGFATGDVTLGGTAGATTAEVTGSGTTYTVAVSGMTGNGTVTASIAANVVDGGNQASTSTDNEVTYNVPKPTVAINQAEAQADPTSGSPINFTVVFSAPVTGFATGDVTLGGTAGATTAEVTGSGTTYTVAVSGMTGNGTVTASIAADVVDGGNQASTSTDNEVTYTLPVTGFALWQQVNGTEGALNLDHDGDGVSNGVEYFLGGSANTTGPTTLPAVTNTGGVVSITWTKAADYPGVYGTDFSVETSDTLAGSWTAETVGGTVTVDGNNVTYTFPTPLGARKFVRLAVTGP